MLRFLGFFYQRFGSSKTGNAFLTAYKVLREADRLNPAAGIQYPSGTAIRQVTVARSEDSPPIPGRPASTDREAETSIPP